MITALLGFSLIQASLDVIPARLKEMVEANRTPGAVVLVSVKGRVLLHEAVGFADVEAKQSLNTNSIFRIASMTKPVTATAIMILADEGKLTLNDPIDRYLPEFREVKVQTPDGLKSPTSRIRIRHLLTHMSGINGNDPDPITDEVKSKMTLSDYAKTLSTTPLLFEPGSSISYSGRGTSVAGRIVEVVSQERFESFVERRILSPLNMTDTHFFLPPAKHNRLAKLYFVERKGLIADSEDRFRAGAKLANPAGGLYSTASDMAKFLSMFLNEGQKVL
ncbi:MAG TPA: serine hydrolase domain-containing protein, partial [Fimbriimonadaceae bacterium]|nr:serine hydrolase domain-containing protein [Fimbriimonadaceae bacterium]